MTDTPDPTMITVCETCGFSEEEKTRGGATGGETFAALVEAAAAETPGVAVRRHACLMGCGHPVNAAISAEGKLAYVLGRFEPTEENARALVDYAAKHAESESGTVPYRAWPAGVKGKFVSRVPPLKS